MGVREKERKTEGKIGEKRRKDRKEGGREVGKKESINNQTANSQPMVATWHNGFSQSQRMILLKESQNKPASQEEIDYV